MSFNFGTPERTASRQVMTLPQSWPVRILYFQGTARAGQNLEYDGGGSASPSDLSGKDSGSVRAHYEDQTANEHRASVAEGVEHDPLQNPKYAPFEKKQVSRSRALESIRILTFRENIRHLPRSLSKRVVVLRTRLKQLLFFLVASFVPSLRR